MFRQAQEVRLLKEGSPHNGAKVVDAGQGQGSTRDKEFPRYGLQDTIG